MVRAPGTVALVLVLYLAGCAEPAPPAQAVASTTSEFAQPAGFSESTGGIEGLVHGADLLPIPGANVTLVSLQTIVPSDADGRFSFSFIEPGDQEIRVEHPDYAGTVAVVRVVAGEVALTKVLLSSTPVNVGYFVTQIQRGTLGCGIALGGLIGILLSCPLLDDQFGNQNPLLWKLTSPAPLWRGAVFEMEWRSTQTFGRSLAFSWEVLGCGTALAEEALGWDDGRSPLRDEINSTGLKNYFELKGHGCGDPAKVCNADGCTLESYVWGIADTLGPGSPVDATIVMGQPFTQYQTEFYYEEGPVGFSALPDR